MRPILAFAAYLVAVSTVAAPPARACGPDTDCTVGERIYRLYVPEDVAGTMGVIAFAHGYRGSAAGTMRNPAFRRIADDLGMAFVALDAGADDWNLAHRPRAPEQQQAREYTYVEAVMADLAGRIALDTGRSVLTGFSAGGMFAWTIACGRSGSFAGYVPMSGTFWAPVPATCPSPPAPLVHIHGTADGVVPLDGRAIGTARQGSVPEALALYARLAGVGDGPDTTVEAPGTMTCARYDGASSDVLEICTFDGGHAFSTARLRYGIARVLGDA